MSTGTRPHALFVTAHFPPDRGPATHRVLRFASHLIEAGWAVTVLTLEEGAYRPGTPVDRALIERVPPEVEVVRTWARRPIERLAEWRRASDKAPVGGPTPASAPAPQTRSRSPRSSRLSGFVSDVLSLPDRDIGWYRLAVAAGHRVLGSHPASVIVSTAPPFTAHLVARRLHRRSGSPWIADFRDPWSRAPWALEQRTTSWQGWIHRRLERRTVRAASRLVLNTSRMRDDFVTHYPDLSTDHFVAIPNGFDPHVLDAVTNLAPSEDGPVRVTHAGTLYGARNPAVLFQALRLLVDSGRLVPGQLEIQLLGAVSGNFGARAMVERLHLGAFVSFQKPVPHAEALRTLAASHALLLFQQGTDLQVPAKLYEYVGLRRPIIAVAPSPSAVGDVVEGTGLGVMVAPDDVARLADVLDMTMRRRPLSTPDEGAISRYDGERLGGEFVALAESLRRDS